MKGIDLVLQAQYSARQWRQLTHGRSLATGSYRRDGSVSPRIALHQHRSMVSKGFELVSIDNPYDGLSGPWVSEIQ